MDVDCATDTSVDEDNEDNDAVAAAAPAASSAAAVDEDEEVDAHDDDGMNNLIIGHPTLQTRYDKKRVGITSIHTSIAPTSVCIN